MVFSSILLLCTCKNVRTKHNVGRCNAFHTIYGLYHDQFAKVNGTARTSFLRTVADFGEKRQLGRWKESARILPFRALVKIAVTTDSLKKNNTRPRERLPQ